MNIKQHKVSSTIWIHILQRYCCHHGTEKCSPQGLHWKVIAHLKYHVLNAIMYLFTLFIKPSIYDTLYLLQLPFMFFNSALISESIGLV